MELIAGRYEVIEELGPDAASMGYLCRHRELSGLKVMVRVFFSDICKDEQLRSRLSNSIRSFMGITHSNVLRVYEYLQDADLLLYSMENPGGPDLGEKIEHAQFTVGECIRMLKQLAQGVQAIHDYGIIHRDLKPEAVYLTGDGSVKIAPSLVALVSEARLSETGGVLGVIDYVSPEYMERGETTHLTDIYALGVLGYELVTGELPFRGKSVIETMTQRLAGITIPPHERRQDCPKELSDIILKAMKKDPAERFQSAEEMAGKLDTLTS